MSLDTLANFADIAAVPIAILGVYLVVHQLLLSRLENEKEHSRKQKEVTLNTFSLFREDARASLLKIREELGVNDVDVLTESNLVFLDNNKSVKNELEKVLNQMERLSVGVHHEIYSLNLVSDLSGTVFIRMFDQLKPYVDEKRKDSRFFYTEFEKLAIDLKQMRRP
jgi:hypothetical protein